MAKIVWQQLDKYNLIGTMGNRLFRLHGGAYGVYGQGYAFYLDTKLKSETKFESLSILFQVKPDRNLIYLDKKMTHGKPVVNSESYKGRLWSTYKLISADNQLTNQHGQYKCTGINYDDMKKAVQEIANTMF